MAIRKKSIKVAVNFGAPADQADNANTTIGTPTIFIPENGVSTPVTFTSVALHLYVRSVAAVYDIQQIVITTTLAGATAATYNQTGTITNTGEDSGYSLGPFDFTSHFVTNYGTVTSKAVTVQTQFNTNTIATRGVYGYFEISYEYDDVTTNRIQTICIPHESPLGSLSTTANTIVTNMKQLTGVGGLFENYGSVVLRQRWIELKSNTDANTNATDITLSFRFDAGTTLTLPIFEQGGAFDYWTLSQIDASALTTNATHTFALWSSVAQRFQNVIMNEWITIEYTTIGTTQFLNYVELPLEIATPVAGTTAAVEHVFKRMLNIQEPNTITFLFGGVEFFYNTNNTAALSMKFGSQSVYRSYTNIGGATGGCFGFQHGFDSDASDGSGLTLNRGDNVLTVQAFRTSGIITNTTGTIRIVYKSGVGTNDVGAHNNVRYGVARQWGQTTAVTDDSVTDSFTIPEINYFLTAAGFNFYGISAVGVLAINFMARLLTGEGNGNGWRELYADYALTDAEVQTFLWVVRLRDDFKRYPNDTDDSRMNIELSRSFRIAFSTATRYGYTWTLTYHTISYTISGNTQNSNGGTIIVDLFQVYSNDEIRWYDTTTVIGNTSFSFTVYDNTKDYYVVAYETDNFKGSSLRGIPGDTFNISLTSGGGGTPRIYGFGSA